MYVSLTPGAAVIPLRGTDVASVFFRADAAQLAEVVRLVEAGRSRCASPARTRWRRPPTRTPASRQAACVDGPRWCREPPDTSASEVSPSPAERRTT